MEDLDPFCCQNPDCPDYGLRGRGNLRVAFRYRKSPQRRLLACRTCPARFSERKGTALFGTRLPHDKALAVRQHLQDGCGIRHTARLTGVDKDTVVRYAQQAGSHARQTHEELVAFSPATQEAPLDEKWSFVQKKQQHGDPPDPADAHCGDCWGPVACDPEHRLVKSVVVGKRTDDNAHQRVPEVYERTDGRPLNLSTSDEYPAYAQAIATVSAEPESPREGGTAERLPEWLVYATVHKTRQKNRVVKGEARLVFGTLASWAAALVWAVLSGVSTVFVERWHGSDRHGTEDVAVQQGLGRPRGDELRDLVQRQLLLVPADVA